MEKPMTEAHAPVGGTFLFGYEGKFSDPIPYNADVPAINRACDILMDRVAKRGEVQRIIGPRVQRVHPFGRGWSGKRKGGRFYAVRTVIRYCEHRGPEYLQRDGRWVTWCHKNWCEWGSRTELEIALKVAAKDLRRATAPVPGAAP